MSQQLPGAAQNFNQSTGLGGSYLTNFCRAAGDMFSFYTNSNSKVLFAGNSMVGYNPTIFDLNCGTAGACGSSPFIFTDNIILGYTTGTSYYPGNGESPGLFYLSDSSAKVVSNYNVEYGTRNNDCAGPFGAGGTGIICSDPLFQNEPAQGIWPPETALDNFDFYPTDSSPENHAGTTIPDLTTDYYGVSRPAALTIGAVEPQ